MANERDVSLDAMRGIAALAVFGWHAMLAFYPSSSGYLDATPIGANRALAILVRRRPWRRRGRVLLRAVGLRADAA